MSISIPDFSDIADFGPIPPGVADLFANPPAPTLPSPRRTSTPISNRSRSRSRSRRGTPSSHGSTVRSKTPPRGRGRGRGRGSGRGSGRGKGARASASSNSSPFFSSSSGSGSGSSSGSSRRLLFNNNPNFGPINRQRRPGQKVTVTETRTVTTVRKGHPPRVRRVSRRQNLG